jgi:hypothetical protein
MHCTFCQPCRSGDGHLSRDIAPLAALPRWPIRSHICAYDVVHRSFVLDILIARSCRDIGATLVSGHGNDLSRIAKVFSFDFVRPYPSKRGR